MEKKIIITEEQLKKIVDVIKEQKYDDAIVKYQQEKSKQISMSQEDASLLLNVAQNWCQDKREHPDCEEIYVLRSKLNMYN